MSSLLLLPTYSNWLTTASLYIYSFNRKLYVLYLVTLEHIHEDWKDLGIWCNAHRKWRYFLMKYPTGVCIITHTSTIALVVLAPVWQVISKNITQHYTVFFVFPFTFLWPVQSVSPLISGGLTFWVGIWSSLLAQGWQLLFHISWNWVQSPCQVWCPLVLSGQSPQACGPPCVTSCGVWWQCALLKSACQLLLWCCMFNSVFLPKENCFHMTFVLATSCLTCSCGWCLIVVFLSTSHRPHIGHQIFFVTGVTTPCIRVAHALAYGSVQRTKHYNWCCSDIFWIKVWSSIALNVSNLYKRALQWMTTGVEQWQWTMTIN